jgi:hypothetical protein
MADKMKIPTQRAHKQSMGTARGARGVRLTDVQKVLISNGGVAHSVLRGRGRKFAPAPKRRPKED